MVAGEEEELTGELPDGRQALLGRPRQRQAPVRVRLGGFDADESAHRSGPPPGFHGGMVAHARSDVPDEVPRRARMGT